MGTGLAVAIAGLSKDYGSGHGLYAIDLKIEPGEVFGFLGPNGAGRSTTMRLLLDLIKPTSGSASVLGFDTQENSLEIRRRVAFLPGDFMLYPKLTGAQVLDYLADLRGGIDRRVRDVLAERFDADLDRPIHELSTGNRQKLGLIQAFMHDPELLILDEPIAGLDPLVQQGLHQLLAETSARGHTVFLSSHTLSEVERVTHRVAILRNGRLAVIDSLEKDTRAFGLGAGRSQVQILSPDFVSARLWLAGGLSEPRHRVALRGGSRWEEATARGRGYRHLAVHRNASRPHAGVLLTLAFASEPYGLRWR